MPGRWQGNVRLPDPPVQGPTPAPPSREPFWSQCCSLCCLVILAIGIWLLWQTVHVAGTIGGGGP